MAAAACQRGACRFRALGKQARHNMLPPQLAPLMGVLAVAAAVAGMGNLRNQNTETGNVMLLLLLLCLRLPILQGLLPKSGWNRWICSLQ